LAWNAKDRGLFQLYSAVAWLRLFHLWLVRLNMATVRTTVSSLAFDMSASVSVLFGAVFLEKSGDCALSRVSLAARRTCESSKLYDSSKSVYFESLHVAREKVG
jgi:hypothetical protein